MLNNIIHFSIKNKLVIGLFTLALICFRVPIRLPNFLLMPHLTSRIIRWWSLLYRLATGGAGSGTARNLSRGADNGQHSGYVDMRSFFRFGLSIVTIVFWRKGRHLLGRGNRYRKGWLLQLKISPKGFLRLKMAPTTGFGGEIYQYVIHPKKGYEDKYDATELRTIQDWIIKRSY